MPHVSVIIPTYQHGSYISSAIDSVLSQTYRNYEIIVIDDGSTDNTKDILKPYGNIITVIYQENRGLSAARNKGIQNSSGELIAFLDADDFWLPQKLEKQVPFFSSDEKLGLVFSDCKFMDKKAYYSKTSFQLTPPSQGYVFSELFLTNFIPVLTTIIRRECFDDLGFFDENLSSCEDYDMWLRISKNWKVAYVNEPLSVYRISSGQMSRDYERMYRNLLIVKERAYRSSDDLKNISIDHLEKHYFRIYLRHAKYLILKGEKKAGIHAVEKYNRYTNLSLNKIVLKTIIRLPIFILANILRIWEFVRVKSELEKGS